jgi:kumamolisin
MHKARRLSAKAGLCALAVLSTTGLVAAGALMASSPASGAGSATAGTNALAGLVASVPKLLENTVPSVVADATRVGQIAGNTTLTLIAPLTLNHQSELNAYVKDEYTPGTSEYHDFLNPNGFAQFFGATTAHLNAVTSVLTNLGFHVAAPAANHLYVTFSGPASLVEQTFSTVIDNLRLPLASTLTSTLTNVTAAATDFVSNVTNLILPTDLANLITGVVGLDSLDTPQPQIVKPTAAQVAEAAAAEPNANANAPALPVTGTDGGTTPCVAALAGIGYTPPALANAYNFTGMYAQGFLGQGMTASLVEFSDYHDSNVSGVQSCYGDQGTAVNRVTVDGGAGGAPGGNETEDMADISVILGMLPKLKNLDVYVGPNTSVGEIQLYSEFATNDDSPVLSSSWGNCEDLDSQSQALLFNDIVEEAAAQGQQIFEAAGDSGAAGCSGMPAPTGQAVNVEEEAANPYVTGVGGTDLGVRTTLGLGHDEDAWNDEIGAGGGGVSSLFTMPSYQADLPSAVAAPGASGAPCGSLTGSLCREVPDVSMNADLLFGLQTKLQPQFTDDLGSPGYSIYCNTPNCSFLLENINGLGLPITIQGPLPTLPDGLLGWQPVGGTSLATPMTASAALLWDQDAESHGLSNGLGFLNPGLYSVAANPTKYASDFFDVVGGSNSDQYATGCPAGCNVNHLYPAVTGYDMATGLGSINVANLGHDLIAQATALTLTPNQVNVFGQTGGPSTTTPVLVSSGYSGDPFNVLSNASWLHVSAGTIGHNLTWSVNPTGLSPGIYHGVILVAGQGTYATLAVTYEVTRPASISLNPGGITFSESAVTSTGKATTPSCNDTLWNDELTGTAGGTQSPRNDLASTLSTLDITNSGPAGSLLHWAAYLNQDTGGWLNPDLDPPGAKPAQSAQPTLVPTEGTTDAGASTPLYLASLANSETVGGAPIMNQGTYKGEVVIFNLADPTQTATVPVTLVLGDGKGTPTMATNSSISVSVTAGQITTSPLTLSDISKGCGYGYSVGSSVPWAIVPSAAADGTVPVGGGTATVPLTIDASEMLPGVYHGEISIQSANAEPGVINVPITLTVTSP